MPTELLGSLEQVVLLALLRLGPKAYGVTVRREIQKQTRSNISIGSIYATLDRLESKGYVSSFLGEPTAERGGRAKKYFRVEAEGRRALAASQQAIRRLSLGLNRRFGVS